MKIWRHHYHYNFWLKVLAFGISRVVKSLWRSSRFLAKDVAGHDLDGLVNKPVFWSDGDGVSKNHIEEAGNWFSRNKCCILCEVSWWSISSWLFLECWQLDISSKNIIISDTSLSLSHMCNNCIYLKQNYSLKYCFASWYSFWPAHDWIISAACLSLIEIELLSYEPGIASILRESILHN